jgi:SRSO17 transposase
MLVTFAPSDLVRSQVVETDGLRSAKTSSNAQLKNRHYNRGLESVKRFSTDKADFIFCRLSVSADFA